MFVERRSRQIAQKASLTTTAVFDDGRIKKPRDMDVETSVAIEQLGRRIDAFETSLRSEFRAGLGKLGSRFDAMEPRFDAMEPRFGGLESRFDGLESRFDTMESGLEARFAESRRHIDVLFESLRDDIRMLAEAFATMSAKRESDRR